MTRRGWGRGDLGHGAAALVLILIAAAGCASGGRPAGGVTAPGAAPRTLAVRAGNAVRTAPVATPVEVYRIDGQAGGKAVTFVKRYDPGSGGMAKGILAPDGSLVPEPPPPVPDRVSAVLRNWMATAGPQDRRDVFLWLAVPRRALPNLPADPRNFSPAAFAQDEAAALATYQSGKNAAVGLLGLLAGELLTEVTDSPAVVASLTPARLRAVLTQPVVLGAVERPPHPVKLDTPRTPDLGVRPALDETGMTTLHDTLHLIGGATGKLAVWEEGSCIDSYPIGWRIEPPGGGPCDMHANQVMKVGGSFDLFSLLVDSTYSDPDSSEEDAVVKTVQQVLPYVVINKSEVSFYDMAADWPKNAYLNPTDQIIDAMTNTRLGAQFTLAAGNNQGGEFVLHHSFNTLKVAETMGASSWKNPVSPHGDRELPEIAAPVFTPYSGTSFAAPAVAGTITVLQDYNGAMILPQIARSVLLAGAWHQLDPGTSWIDDVKAHTDRHYGAGELNARYAYDILTAAGLWTPGTPGGDGGARWTVAYDPGDGSTFHADFPLQLSGDGGPVAFRAALAWNNDTTGALGWGSWDLYDLDLLLLDGTGAVAASAATFDNNYEILEAQLQRGTAYTLRVVGTTLPAGGAVIAGVAWNVAH